MSNHERMAASGIRGGGADRVGRKAEISLRVTRIAAWRISLTKTKRIHDERECRRRLAATRVVEVITRTRRTPSVRTRTSRPFFMRASTRPSGRYASPRPSSALAAAQLRDALLTPQALEHDADLLLGRELPARGTPGPSRPLPPAVSPARISASSSLLTATMNQKSSLPE